MAREIVGRVQPAAPVAYDANATYGKLERVLLDGTTWECVSPTEPGQGPAEAAEKWVAISAGVTHAEIAAMQEKLTQSEGGLAAVAQSVTQLSQNQTAIAQGVAANQSALEQNASELARVKATADAAATQTALNAVKATADAALPAATATSTYATKTETAAIKATADAAATKTALDAVKKTADGALQKSGGTLTGPLDLQANQPAATTPSAQTHVSLYMRGNDNQVFGLVRGWLHADNSRAVSIAIKTHADKYLQPPLEIRGTDEGYYYATCPPPRSDNYGNDIVTMKAMKDYAVMKAPATFHVGGNNASDTADLFSGRGESADKPFATLAGAFSYIRDNLSRGGSVTIQLHADVIWDSANDLYLPQSAFVRLESDSTKRTITCNKSFAVTTSSLFLRNIKLVAGTSLNRCLTASGYISPAQIIIQNGLEFSGTVTEAVIYCTYSASVILDGIPTGSVTGKKYSCTNGGMIYGASKIPGTIDGTCDANSKAFG